MTDIEIINPYNERDHAADKLSILDIKGWMRAHFSSVRCISIFGSKNTFYFPRGSLRLRPSPGSGLRSGSCGELDIGYWVLGISV